MSEPKHSERARGERPLFVVLDGVDGCGKTTQASRLVARLRSTSGRPVLHLREPGGAALSERLRELVLSRAFEIEAGVELLLFAAARRQMLRELVAPALERGEHVVCERFHASTFAYQAVAGGLPEADVLALLTRWASDPSPTHVIVIDVDPAAASLRRASASDRIEDKGLEFQRLVARGYRRYAELTRGVALVDGARSEAEVAEAIWREVRRG